MLNDERRAKIKYLSQIKYLDKDIDRSLEELEYWQTKAEKVTSSITGMPGSHDNDRTDIVVKIADMKRDINNKIDKLVDTKREIEAVIEGVQDLKLREILKCRYLDMKTWEEIAYTSNYCWQHVFRLHEQALDKINMR